MVGFERSETVKNLACAVEIQVKPDAVVDGSFCADTCNEGFLNIKSQVFNFLFQVRSEAFMAGNDDRGRSGVKGHMVSKR